MATQQQDYLLRHIQTISRLVASLRRKGSLQGGEDLAEINETLLLALHLQEKNFGRPAALFLALSADEQIAALHQGETSAGGQARCLTYVSLLRDTAELYAWRGSTDLALGARQLALYVALGVAVAAPSGAAAAPDLVREILVALDGAELPPPTRELLDRFEAGGS